MADVGQSTSPDPPELRLEKLRFFAVERDDFPPVLGDWMQEVEAQIAALRNRLNGLPKDRRGER